jgi:Ca-activated chloride channel homolog
MDFACIRVDFIMIRRILVLICALAIWPLQGFCFWGSERAAWKSFLNKDYNRSQQLLKFLQVDDPSGEKINYNLGSVNYKLGLTEDAKNEFARAVEAGYGKNSSLVGMSYFNWGNCFIKEASDLLGEDWEKKKIDDGVLGQAITAVRGAIEKYKNALSVACDDEHADANLKKAEELLKKLEEKRKQQQQNKQQNDPKKQQDKKSEQNKDNKGQDSDQKNDGKNDSQKPENSGDERKDDRSKDDQDKDGKKDKSQHDNTTDKEQQSQQDTNSQDKDKKPDKQDMGASQQEPMGESMEMKGVRALLDKLQDDEKKLQKALMRAKGKGKEKKQTSTQKPW